LHLRRPTICIKLGDFLDRFEIKPTEGIAQDITGIIEYSTSQVYAINYKTMEYKGQLTGSLNREIYNVLFSF
jgi:hypothetical protein